MKHLRGRRVSIPDIVVREGLQIDLWQIPASGTIALIDPLARTDLTKVEFIAFVSSTPVPPIADAAKVVLAPRTCLTSSAGLWRL